ncbi:hypothetical protein LOD99_13290 [Oopsacas minuta]|uniref:Uncharacterized protein n=1 Tax=Oopsacas minuta TaxID=111878 RepID=A0AAV7KKL6_9METZ|nr:hypothetical protein LOD99_13290 [Oopsacas minuta]
MSIWLADGRLRLWCKGGQLPVKQSNKCNRNHMFGEQFCSCDLSVECFLGEPHRRIIYEHPKRVSDTQAQLLYPDSWVFQEGNDQKHTSNVAQTFRECHNIFRMEWPACSPDLTRSKICGLESNIRSI